MDMKGRVLLLGGNGMVGRNILSNEHCNRWEFLSPKSKDLNLVDFDRFSTNLQHLPRDMAVFALPAPPGPPLGAEGSILK